MEKRNQPNVDRISRSKNDYLLPIKIRQSSRLKKSTSKQLSFIYTSNHFKLT